jgi:hypothetical protein
MEGYKDTFEGDFWLIKSMVLCISQADINTWIYKLATLVIWSVRWIIFNKLTSVKRFPIAERIVQEHKFILWDNDSTIRNKRRFDSIKVAK